MARKPNKYEIETEQVKELHALLRKGAARFTVRTWRKRFLEDGIEGLKDLPRPGTADQNRRSAHQEKSSNGQSKKCRRRRVIGAKG